MINYKTEYLNLCIEFGSYDIDMVISFKTYCNLRKVHSMLELYNDIDHIINIDN